MYGLPPNTNLGFLEGATLLQACFGEHDLILNFSGNISVAIFSEVGVGLREDCITRYISFTEVSIEILGFLNKEVVAVKWTSDGMVTMAFENSRVLRLYDDSADFESFTITSPHGQLIV